MTKNNDLAAARARLREALRGRLHSVPSHNEVKLLELSAEALEAIPQRFRSVDLVTRLPIPEAKGDACAGGFRYSLSVEEALPYITGDDTKVKASGGGIPLLYITHRADAHRMGDAIEERADVGRSSAELERRAGIRRAAELTQRLADGLREAGLWVDVRMTPTGPEASLSGPAGRYVFALEPSTVPGGLALYGRWADVDLASRYLNPRRQWGAELNPFSGKMNAYPESEREALSWLLGKVERIRRRAEREEEEGAL